MKKIVLTRSFADNLELLKQFEFSRYEIINFPSIEILADYNLKVKPNLNNYHCLVFTSKNSIKFTKKYLDFLLTTIPNDIKIALIGKASQNCLQDNFNRTADLIADWPSSQELAKKITDNFPPASKLLFFTGNLTFDTLPQILKSKGYFIDQLPVYKNVVAKLDQIAYQQIVNSNPKDLVFIFFSPSAVRNTKKLLSTNGNYLVNAQKVVIGSSSLLELERLGLKADYQLPSFCLNSISDYINNLK